MIDATSRFSVNASCRIRRVSNTRSLEQLSWMMKAPDDNNSIPDVCLCYFPGWNHQNIEMQFAHYLFVLYRHGDWKPESRTYQVRQGKTDNLNAKSARNENVSQVHSQASESTLEAATKPRQHRQSQKWDKSRRRAVHRGSWPLDGWGKFDSVWSPLSPAAIEGTGPAEWWMP